MRIMFVAAPLQGHVLPLIPLAAACRDAGHDVTVASGGFPPDVLGLRTADIGASFSLPRSAIRVALRHPRVARAEMRGTAGHAMVGELFGRANLALVGPLLAVAAKERPDLIVYESLGEAYDMLEQLELSNDVPEVLGDDDTVDGVREELDFGLETAGPDTLLSTLV